MEKHLPISFLMSVASVALRVREVGEVWNGRELDVPSAERPAPSAWKSVLPLTRPKTACYARGLSLRRAKVAELADAPDLGSGGREALGVRLPPFAEALARAHPPSSCSLTS